MSSLAELEGSASPAVQHERIGGEKSVRRFTVLAPVDPQFNNLSLLRECLRSRPRGRPLPPSFSFFLHGNTTQTLHSFSVDDGKVPPNCSLFSVFPARRLLASGVRIIIPRLTARSPATFLSITSALSLLFKERLVRLSSFSRKHLAHARKYVNPHTSCLLFTSAPEKNRVAFLRPAGRISFPNVIQSRFTALAFLRWERTKVRLIKHIFVRSPRKLIATRAT